MFTGIIEETGSIDSVKRGHVSSRLRIKGAGIFDDLGTGDSVAVNGVCLTAALIDAENRAFEADVMAETLRRSNLGNLRAGSRVNLERAMPAYGRFGGHIVSGHIDGTGVISSMKREENAVWVTVDADSSLMKYIVEKGSIAIDGISLTVAETGEGFFKVSVIPHTGAETTLLTKRQGDIVNLENDVIGKYVERMLYSEARETKTGGSAESGITLKMLAENGFMRGGSLL